MMTTVQQGSLTELKHQVDSLKRKLSDPDAKIDELLLEIETLKDFIHELTVIFQKALQQTKADDGLHDVRKKLDEVLNQNETIAKGMVAIADKLEDFIRKQTSPLSAMGPAPFPRAVSPSMVQHTMGMPAPPLGTPARMAPRPMMAPPGMGATDLPPPPPPVGSEKRKALGGLFK